MDPCLDVAASVNFAVDGPSYGAGLGTHQMYLEPAIGMYLQDCTCQSVSEWDGMLKLSYLNWQPRSLSLVTVFSSLRFFSPGCSCPFLSSLPLPLVYFMIPVCYMFLHSVVRWLPLFFD